jgi:c-di-GMP-binding flagellar brake protein YcgR
MTPKEISEILHQLRAGGTLVKLRLPGRNYERLTVVIDIQRRERRDCFRLDRPRDFNTQIADGQPITALLEFTGRDKLSYILRTEGLESTGGELWIPFPEHIERVQRRRHFRVQCPMGSQLTFQLKGQPTEMALVNVSIGGALGLLVRLKRELLRQPLMEVGQTLTGGELVFPEEREALRVPLGRMVVRRVEKNQNDNYMYGLEFVEMSKAAERSLTEQVLKLQRFWLQRARLERE